MHGICSAEIPVLICMMVTLLLLLLLLLPHVGSWEDILKRKGGFLT